MGRPRFAIVALFLCTYAIFLYAQKSGSDSVHIIRPAAREVVTTNSLAIEAEIQSGISPDSVLFYATFIDAGFNETDTVFKQFRMRQIGVDSAFPYQMIWDISRLQDHYHFRLYIDAWALMSSGDTLKARTGNFVVDRHAGRKLEMIAKAPFIRKATARVGWMDSTRAYSFLSSDNQIRFRPFWTHDSLLLFADIRDGSVITVPQKDHRFWTADDIELYFDIHNTASPIEMPGMFQFVISPDGRAYGGKVSLLDNKERAPIQVAAQQSDSGYALRIALCWEDLGKPAPRAGDTLGFEIANFERDRRDGLVSMSSWAGNHLGNLHNASEWGRIILTPREVDYRIAWIVALLAAGLGTAALVMIRRGRKRGQQDVHQAEAKNSFDRAKVSSLTAAALKIVEADFMDEKCSLEYVAGKLNRTAKHISSVFRKDTGVCFTEYLNDVRLRAADQLLRTSRKTAFDVSIDVGYHSYEYFSRIYKKKFGVSPSKARQPQAAPIKAE